MAQPIFMEVVFNQSHIKKGNLKQFHHELSPENLLALIQAPRGISLSSFSRLAPVPCVEFASESDGVFLRPFFHWIQSQTTAEFRPLRRADFVHLYSPNARGNKVATWMLYNRKSDAATLRKVFTVVVEDTQNPSEVLAWGRLDPRLPNNIPGKHRNE